eukprot:1161773-Pelagomonas_calceolata.AAC.23
MHAYARMCAYSESAGCTELPDFISLIPLKYPGPAPALFPNCMIHGTTTTTTTTTTTAIQQQQQQ